MAELLADERVRGRGREGVEAAFVAFDRCRREFTQWLVQSSRRTGDLYDWRAEGVGENIEHIAKECRERNGILWNGQISEMVEEAKKELGKVLGAGEEL